MKSENGKLKSQLNHDQLQNKELYKLIDTMCSPPEPTAPETPADDTNEQQWETPLSTANRFQVLSEVRNDSGAEVPSQTLTSNQDPDQRIPRGSTPSHRCTVNPTTVTIVGSSIVRGVAPLVDHGDEFEAIGFAYPGRTAREINGRIKNIPDSDVLAIAAGTVNISSQSVNECTREIREVIDNVSRKRNGKPVIMSQIPRRRDDAVLNLKIDRVNDFIAKQIRTREHWHLLKHELNYRDYKRDGLHLNERGTAKYALEIRHILRHMPKYIKE